MDLTSCLIKCAAPPMYTSAWAAGGKVQLTSQLCHESIFQKDSSGGEVLQRMHAIACHECLGELCIVVVIFAADHVSVFLNVSVIKFFSNLLIVCSVQ